MGVYGTLTSVNTDISTTCGDLLFQFYEKKGGKSNRAYSYRSKEFVAIGRQLVIEVAYQLGKSNQKALALENILQLIEDTFLARQQFDAVEEILETYVQEHFPHIIEVQQIRVQLEEAREKDRNSIIRLYKILIHPEQMVETKSRQSFRNIELRIFSPSLQTCRTYLYYLPGKMCLGAVLSRLVEDKRVRLDRNPHFYEKFPSREDGNIISLDLIQQLDTLGSTQNRWLVLYILTDRKSCVFFKCNIPYRVFGNVWDFGGKIIMKDVRGHLHDSSILGMRITHSVQCWSREKLIAGEHKWDTFLKCALENTNLDLLICPRLKPWVPSTEDGIWYEFTTTSSTLS